MVHTDEIDGAIIVLRGSFNPAIFHPHWLAAEGLIRPEEEDTAVVRLMEPRLSVLTLGDDPEDPNVNLVVQPERLEAEALRADGHLPLRDLVVGIFRILLHSPVQGVAMGRHMHFRSPERNAWQRLSGMLYQAGPWQQHFQQPGLSSLTLRSTRTGNDEFTVRVEPSKKVEGAIYVGAYEKHERPAGGVPGAAQLLDIVETEWEESIRFSRTVAETLFSNVPEEPR